MLHASLRHPRIDQGGFSARGGHSSRLRGIFGKRLRDGVLGALELELPLCAVRARKSSQNAFARKDLERQLRPLHSPASCRDAQPASRRQSASLAPGGLQNERYRNSFRCAMEAHYGSRSIPEGVPQAPSRAASTRVTRNQALALFLANLAAA